MKIVLRLILVKIFFIVVIVIFLCEKKLSSWENSFETLQLEILFENFRSIGEKVSKSILHTTKIVSPVSTDFMMEFHQTSMLNTYYPNPPSNHLRTKCTTRDISINILCLKDFLIKTQNFVQCHGLYMFS